MVGFRGTFGGEGDRWKTWVGETGGDRERGDRNDRGGRARLLMDNRNITVMGPGKSAVKDPPMKQQ